MASIGKVFKENDEDGMKPFFEFNFMEESNTPNGAAQTSSTSKKNKKKKNKAKKTPAANTSAIEDAPQATSISISKPSDSDEVCDAISRIDLLDKNMNHDESKTHIEEAKQPQEGETNNATMASAKDSGQATTQSTVIADDDAGFTPVADTKKKSKKKSKKSKADDSKKNSSSGKSAPAGDNDLDEMALLEEMIQMNATLAAEEKAKAKLEKKQAPTKSTTDTSKSPIFLSSRDPELDEKAKMKLKYGKGKNLVAIGPPKRRDISWLKSSDSSGGFPISPPPGIPSRGAPEGDNTGMSSMSRARGDGNRPLGQMQSAPSASSAQSSPPSASPSADVTTTSNPFSFGFGFMQ
jgi:hypothetical protein